MRVFCSADNPYHAAPIREGSLGVFGLEKICWRAYPDEIRSLRIQVEKCWGILRGTELGGVTGNRVGITTVAFITLCVFLIIYSLYYSDPSAVVA